MRLNRAGSGMVSELHSLRTPTGSPTGPVFGLIVTKILRTLGLLAAGALLAHVTLSTFVAGLLAGSAACFVILQRPFTTGKRLSGRLLLRVLQHSCLLWVYVALHALGLFLCGPVRTLLLCGYSGVPFLGIGAAVLRGGNTPAPRVRGALLSLGALFLLLLWDDPVGSHAVAHVDETGGAHQDFQLVRHSKYFAALMVPDQSVGMASLVAASCFNLAQKAFSKRVGVEVGGGKRLQALSTAFAAGLAAVVWLSGRANLRDASMLKESPAEHLLGYFAASCLFFVVVDSYIERAVTARLAHPTATVPLYGLATSFVVAAVLESGASDATLDKAVPSSVNYVTGLAAALLMGGTYFLTVPVGGTGGESSRGLLIGYAPDGLPLYHVQSSKMKGSLLNVAWKTLQAILNSYDSRQIFYFLCINFGFMIVEFVYGMYSNSLGLISDAFHMLFDCTALMVGLYAAIMAKWKPSKRFSYGFGRVEVLSGFANSLFLVVIAANVLWEALQRIINPPEVKTNRLLAVSIGGLLVNLVGMFAFSHAHAASHGGTCSHGHGEHAHDHRHSHSHGHSHGNKHRRQSVPEPSTTSGNANMQGVFLHVMADTLGSVGVIVSSFLIENFGWHVADPICSVFIAVLIGLSVIPLLRQSLSVLLLETPEALGARLQDCLRQIRELDGVLGYRHPHFWKHTQSVSHGTLHVVVTPSANAQHVLQQASAILAPLGLASLSIQVEMEAYVGRRAVIGRQRHAVPDLEFSKLYAADGSDIKAL